MTEQNEAVLSEDLDRAVLSKIAVYGLIGYAFLALAGSLVIVVMGRELPETLISTLSMAIGALVGRAGGPSGK